MSGKLSESAWAQISRACETRIAYHRLQIAKLRAAIKLFDEKERNGEPWPEEESEDADHVETAKRSHSAMALVRCAMSTDKTDTPEYLATCLDAVGLVFNTAAKVLRAGASGEISFEDAGDEIACVIVDNESEPYHGQRPRIATVILTKDRDAVVLQTSHPALKP